MGQSAATAPQERPPEADQAKYSFSDEAEDSKADEANDSMTNEAKESPRSPRSPSREPPTPVRTTVAAGDRLKRLFVSGAGLVDVNGTYSPATAFAGAEVFVKESTEFGTIYIRRQAENLPKVWVITLSPTHRESRHLYKRDGVMVGKETPPLLGWTVYPSGDGVEHGLERKLGDAPGRLEYYEVRQRNMASPDDGKPDVEAVRGPDIFRSDTGCLQVCIVGASNLQTTDNVELEPYCTCEIPGKSEGKFETPLQQATVNPLWKYIFEVEDFDRDDVLMFSVKSDGVLLGQATLEHSKVFPQGFLGDVRLEVPDSDSNEALLSLCITPSNQEVPGIFCEIDKSVGHVGVGIAPEMLKQALSVRTIAEGGQIDRWNQDHPLQNIKIRDRVVEVNGKQGTCKDLLNELARAQGPLKMVVKRKMSF